MDLIEKLAAVGVGVGSERTGESDNKSAGIEISLSAYGEFTPISVKSYTETEEHADLESD